MGAILSTVMSVIALSVVGVLSSMVASDTSGHARTLAIISAIISFLTAILAAVIAVVAF